MSERTTDAASRADPGARRVFLAISAAMLLGTVVAFGGVLLPFALATVLAYVFAPLVTRLERWRFRPRWAIVLGLYTALLAGLWGAIAYGTPRLAAETRRFAHDAPRMLERLREEWLPDFEARLRAAVGTEEVDDSPAEPPSARSTAIQAVPLPSGGYEIRLPEGGLRIERDGGAYRVVSAPDPARPPGDFIGALVQGVWRSLNQGEQFTVGALRAAQVFVAGLVRGVFGFFLTLMVSVYLLLTRERIFAFVRTLVRPDRRTSFDELLGRIDRGLAGVVRGQMLIMVINGVLSGIGFYLLDLPYWPILMLVATLFSIIPIFGAILSSVPAVLVALQGGVGTALLTLAWILGIHQLEANVLNPKIMGDQAKVHPVLVIFALLAGEHVYGLAGAILAVPVLSIVQSVFLHYRARVLAEG